MLRFFPLVAFSQKPSLKKKKKNFSRFHMKNITVVNNWLVGHIRNLACFAKLVHSSVHKSAFSGAMNISLWPFQFLIYRFKLWNLSPPNENRHIRVFSFKRIKEFAHEHLKQFLKLFSYYPKKFSKRGKGKRTIGVYRFFEISMTSDTYFIMSVMSLIQHSYCPHPRFTLIIISGITKSGLYLAKCFKNTKKMC